GARSFDELKSIVAVERTRRDVMTAIPASAMSRGPADAAITIEMFADLTSPITAASLDVIEKLMQAHTDAVRLQFRNFPLAFHRQAKIAHEAAVMAATRARFWEFAHYILQHGNAISIQSLSDEARRLGIDQDAFSTSLQQHQYAARVEA